MYQEPVTSYFEMLRDEIPELFLQKLRQCQANIYEEAFGRAYLDVFAKPEAADLSGHLRRALFETQLAKVAEECGLKCEVHSNRKLSEHHRVVQIGRFFLTCSAVRSRQQKPRAAQYRKQAALSPINAFPTFDFLPEPEGMRSEATYVVAVHGPDTFASNRPGFLRIGIPDHNWKNWLDLVDVETLLEAQALRRIVAERERITDRAVPRPKQKKKAEDGER